MTDFSKTTQTRKAKKTNPKKMSRDEKIKYIDFLREKSRGICQIHNCTRPAQDFAHRDRAYKRDDRYGALICRHHHIIADQHTSKQTEASKEVNASLKKIAVENWRDFDTF